MRFRGASVLLLLSLVALVVASGCQIAPATKLKAVTSTSLLSALVKQMAGDRVEVAEIVPAGACPGHFDVKPSDVQLLAQARLFIKHGQPWEGEVFTEAVVRSAQNPNLVVKAANIPGNWMEPSVQAQGADFVASALGELDPANKAYYQGNADKLKSAIQAKGAEVAARLAAAKVSEVKVLCALQQEGFVRWAGFNVVATYPRPEDMTPAQIRDVVAAAKAAGVALVIDNLQSGADAGKGMAEEIGARQLTISNFPGAFENTATWDKAIDKNVDMLLAKLAK